MKRYDNEVILFFADTHAPYHHKHTLDFLRDVNNTFKPDRVIHGGDLLDIYSVSDYPKDLEHKHTWKDEIKKGLKFTSELGKIFPVLELLESNHDSRAYRKSRVAGVPREFLVKYLDFLEAPEGWRFKDDISLTVESSRAQWFFSHTMNAEPIVVAKAFGRSVCLGHNHSRFGCIAFNNGRDTLWGVDSGCLISDKGSPFKYNKGQLGRPIRGCCIIDHGIPGMVSFNVS